MTNNSVMIVCPKYDAYEYKDISQQSFYEKAVDKWYDYFKSLGCEICCFAEDMLAVKLLHDREVTWITTLGASDKLFIESNVCGYPEEYKQVQKTTLGSVRVRESILKYPDKVPTEGVDSEAYLGSKLNCIMNRIRYVANKILVEDAGTIVYLSASASNQFCNLPKEVAGNGKSIVNIRVADCLETFSYGGVEMSAKDFKAIEEWLHGENI